VTADLDGLAGLVRSAPGLLGKRNLELIGELEIGIDGDDAALVAHGDGFLVLCGEAIAPSLVAADPFAAGAAAVVCNVSDVRAMGGRPLAIVDTVVSPDHDHARELLRGLTWAAGLLGVPIAGGHLTIADTAPALSATCTGTVRTPLRAANARPGDALVVAFCTDGRFLSPDGTFFSSLWDRPGELLCTDGEALVVLAEAGVAHAARDVSMPGVAGSLLQLLECCGCGATLDVDLIPRPRGTSIERWILTFPSYGYVLAVDPLRAEAAVREFTGRGLAATVCGAFDDTGVLALRSGGRTAVAWDMRQAVLTGL
jgi:selenophosphate synthetase-related protein